MNLKQKLYHYCEVFIEERFKTIQKTIEELQKALQSETKSSAGDKHETGRAMLQLEREKAGQQLAGITQMKEVLARIDVEKTSKVARLGSLISTDKANYFLSISAGKLEISGNLYFAISVVSPIGKLLLGKQKNDVIIFNNNKSIIKKII